MRTGAGGDIHGPGMTGASSFALVLLPVSGIFRFEYFVITHTHIDKNIC